MSNLQASWIMLDTTLAMTYFAASNCVEKINSLDRNIAEVAGRGRYRYGVVDPIVNPSNEYSYNINRESSETLVELMKDYFTTDAINLWLKQYNTHDFKDKPLFSFATVEIDSLANQAIFYRGGTSEIYVKHAYGWVKLFDDWLTVEGRWKYETAKSAYNSVLAEGELQNELTLLKSGIFEEPFLMKHPIIGLSDSYAPIPVKINLNEIESLALTTDGSGITLELLNSGEPHISNWLRNEMHKENCTHGDVSAIILVF